MTNAVAALAIQLKRGNGAGTEVFTTVAEVKTFSGPSSTLATVDATSFDSAGVVERIAGLMDSGSVTFGCNFVGGDDEQAGLFEDHDDKVLRNFEIVIGASEFAFSAFVTGVGIGASVGEAVMLDVTLEISGSITRTLS